MPDVLHPWHGSRRGRDNILRPSVRRLYQGANDNKSGSAAILEVARVLNKLIAEGRIPRPKRTIRFLWAPEFSGTIPWIKANREIIERTLCDINMDMVGEWLSKNKGDLRQSPLRQRRGGEVLPVYR